MSNLPEQDSSTLHCSQITRKADATIKAHIDGKKHTQHVKGQNQPNLVRNSRKVNPEKYPQHKEGPKSRKKEYPGPDTSTIHTAFDESEKDKHGVTLKGKFDFGFVESTSTISSRHITILSTTAENINVSEIRLSSSTVWRASHFGIEHPELPRSLTPTVEETFSITFDPQNILGRHNDRVEVVFQHLGLNQQFVITRSIQAMVGNEADLELLKPSAPYIPQLKKARKQQTKELPLPGIKPASLANMQWLVGLPLSPVPKSLVTILNLDDKKETMTILKHHWLPRTLNAKSHGRFFQILVHAEEVQMSVDLQCHDMQDVEMDHAPPYYRLSVPDLAEKRPGIVIGDRLLVQPKDSKDSDQWFEGFVHHMHQEGIDLQFHKSFNGEKGQRYDARFQLDRIPFRRMQQALALSHSPERLLFPSAIHIEDRSKVLESEIQKLHCINKNVESNPQQLLAVASIVYMPEGSVPFVVFGPPGTGKTVVIVEAILQILSTRPQARILACATSNSAADLLVERLKDTFTTSEMFRLNAPSRQKDSMSKTLRPYSRFNSAGAFCVPTLSEVKEFRIIVATCVASSILYGIGFKSGHFPHIFIDEAGQASEPEVMIPIKMLASEKTNIILSGDPKQLGPIVRSAAAGSLGLSISYLERLMARDIYDSHTGNGISVVKLIKNWRSHPVILKYPNEQFYEGELEAHGNQLVTHSLLQSNELVSTDFPIIFHGIIGEDMQQANSPSYFNPNEASVVRGYVDRLLKNSKLGLEGAQIGVIAPYHAQVLKIRTLLRNSGYSAVKVGSVEEFQGQERRVIIVSTVRSNVKHFDFDIRHALGFVANPRRFNVAVTRAQALLITIGNPAVLSLDPLWRGFMNYVFLGGGWRGIQPDWDTKQAVTSEDYGEARRTMAIGELEALIERTKTLILDQNVEHLGGHLKGKKHLRRINFGEQIQTRCELCNVVIPSSNLFPQHVRGARHRQLMQDNPEWESGDDPGQPPPTSPTTIPVGFVRCDTCNLVFPSKYEASHRSSFAHRKKERFFVIHAAFEEADKDKHGVELDGDLDFGFIEFDRVNSSHERPLDILLSTREKVIISEVRLSSAKSQTRAISNFSLGEFPTPCRVKPNIPERLTVIFNTHGLSGRFNDRVEIIFQDITLQKQFAITRPIQAVVGNLADLEFLKPSAPYKPAKRVQPVSDDDPIPGVRPPQLAEIEWAVSLPRALPPKTLETLLLTIRNRGKLIETIKQKWLPPPPLDVDTYTRHFRVLLHIEEVQMKLAVPGLAEKRPSVIIGDKILVQKTGGVESAKWYEGYVHRIHQLNVDLRFHPSFKPLRGQKFNVRFKVCRNPLRRMHQAIATAFCPDRVLFPKPSHIENRQLVTADQLDSIRTVNRSIESNYPQLRAVGIIMDMPPGSVPFVIFGPPGTGKTVTVVEAIRQILFANANARILACAPSNSAADLLAQRLADTLNTSQLFRLNAASRAKKALPEGLLDYSRVNSEETFSIPPIRQLQEFRVIVSTCVSASVPYAIGMARGHFTHIFVDEVGQACEPEVMIPIKTMADNETNIILSGDPRQLGPIVRSPVAASLGLKTSYLDRLMSRTIYDPQIGDGIWKVYHIKAHRISFEIDFVVKLIKNWRNHPSILKYPNEHFYRNDLEPHGDQIVTHSLLRSNELVKPGFPIVFHAILGKDLQEANSPSFFNPDEASVVKAYVERLREDRRLRLQDTQIGIITPYHAQVMKIRALLKKSGYEGIKVGTVEEFQGQERRVIIVSTVRSSMDHIAFDLRHTLGFVASPRRFNVAVTRAQALLIVVGDPSVLSLDPLWRGFLNYIHLEGGWRGVQPDWDTSAPIDEQDYAPTRRQAAERDIDALIERTRTLIFENTLEEMDLGDDEGRVDRSWRETE
ncbi:hypothetical protein Clacol_004852 [Clathrus columnatus]|uniref:RNA helicase n=1 Tax=Clathrus columnatus TaxID=1419009 RepID=A0AAV5ACI6_9AGAM|nr:hypothetical protein Clacol_004852 [Clathrus columnatus]